MDGFATLYLGCIVIGLVFTLWTLLVGNHLGHWHLEIPVLQPVTLISGLTAFGGCGLLFTRWLSFSPELTLLLSAVGGVIIAILSYFFWVKPMEHAETTTGFSVGELQGKLGEVLTTIPQDGLGEVLITMVNGRSNHMAASFSREPIREGSRVVVVEVRDHVLYVDRFDPGMGEIE